jgi:hypothetical protein
VEARLTTTKIEMIANQIEGVAMDVTIGSGEAVTKGAVSVVRSAGMY